MRRAAPCAWLTVAVVIIAVCMTAVADEPAVTRLLKRLELVGYPSGTTPPDFSSQTLAAGRLSMNELRGKVVLVNFWASWCLECRPEMPVFERLHREFGAQGLAVVGVNAREDRQGIRRYARELGLTFALVLDPDGTVYARYGVVGLPTTVVVARDGRAVALAVGPRAWGSPPARALIQALLAEPVQRPP